MTDSPDLFAPKTQQATPIPPPPPPPQLREPEHTEPAVPNNPKGKDLREAAEKWLKENPAVAALFLRFAKELASKGKRFGVSLITERVRYECLVNTSGDEYKINNNHRAYIARWLIAQDPQLEKWMEFRVVNY